MPFVCLTEEDPQPANLQSMPDPPAAVGISFAADVIKRHRQLVRETTSSFTTSCIIDDEHHHTLRASLIRLCLELRPVSGPCAVIRVDPTPGLTSLANDEELRHHKITIEIRRAKNVNKNPVAEKCIAELIKELLRFAISLPTVNSQSLTLI